MSQPKVQDVAKLAGVGTSTVSRVLNNHPNISDEARSRVLGAISQLGYTPNLNARSLRSGQTSAVSVLLPMTGTAFYNELLEGVQEVLDGADLDTALFPVVGGIKIKRYQRPSSLLYRADALLIASLDPDRIYEGRPVPFAKPVVLVDAHHPRYHSVFFDNLAAGRLAANHALRATLPIALIDADDVPGVFESPVLRDRRDAILRTLAQHGVAPFHTVAAPISLEGGRQAAQRLLQLGLEEASFVIALCDELALGAMRQFSEGGWQAGNKLKILGFDGSAAAREAQLTTVEQPVRQMGRQAADLLLEALQQGLPSIQARRFEPTLLKLRSA